MKNRDTIRELNESALKLCGKLKEKRAAEKSLRVSTGRQIAHATALQIDFSKRPPDRYGDIRSYSKMDMDVWKYDQLRSWFQTYAPDKDVTYDLRPCETGYMIKAD